MDLMYKKYLNKSSDKETSYEIVKSFVVKS